MVDGSSVIQVTVDRLSGVARGRGSAGFEHGGCWVDDGEDYECENHPSEGPIADGEVAHLSMRTLARHGLGWSLIEIKQIEDTGEAGDGLLFGSQRSESNWPSRISEIPTGLMSRRVSRVPV
jgi:predicted RNA-binding protein with TRAM domain